MSVRNGDSSKTNYSVACQNVGKPMHCGHNAWYARSIRWPEGNRSTEDILVEHQKSGMFFEQRQIGLKAVILQIICIGFATICARDKKALCTDVNIINKWTAPMLETWIRYINTLHNWAVKFDLMSLTDIAAADYLFIEWSENLKQLSPPTFLWWRMNFHTDTLIQHVYSNEERRCWLEQWCLQWLARKHNHPILFLITNSTGKYKAFPSIA